VSVFIYCFYHRKQLNFSDSIDFFFPSRLILFLLPISQVRWHEKGDGDLLWGGVWIGVSSKSPFVFGPAFSSSTLPAELPLLEAKSIALLSSFSRAQSWWGSTEWELTFTPRWGVVFTDEISGKSDAESNQFVRGNPRGHYVTLYYLIEIELKL